MGPAVNRGRSNAGVAAALKNRASHSERYSGTIGSFSTDNRYGFIECSRLTALYGRDALLHVTELPHFGHDFEVPLSVAGCNDQTLGVRGSSGRRVRNQAERGLSVSGITQGAVSRWNASRGRDTIDVGDIIVSANGSEVIHSESLLQLATDCSTLRLRIRKQVRPTVNDFVRLVNATAAWQQPYHLQTARILEDVGGAKPYKLQGMEEGYFEATAVELQDRRSAPVGELVSFNVFFLPGSVEPTACNVKWQDWDEPLPRKRPFSDEAARAARYTTSTVSYMRPYMRPYCEGAAKKGEGAAKKGKKKDPTKCVWIGNVPENATVKELMELGKQAGDCDWARVFKGKGTGLLHFVSADEVPSAIAALRGAQVGGAYIEADVWEK